MEELNIPPLNIGQRIRQARKTADMSQEELADRVHVNRSYLSLVENGKSSPTIEFLEKIAGGMNMRAEEIILGRALFQHFTLDPNSRFIYKGLADFLADEEQMLLMNPSDEEVVALKSLLVHSDHNPSKKFFVDALLDMRKGRTGKFEY
ncbi:helix-turn-helix transcriptional regulator [bacterium]|nr:helix-turn-helix transcriptional regulator [bacterium]